MKPLMTSSPQQLLDHGCIIAFFQKSFYPMNGAYSLLYKKNFGGLQLKF